MHNINLEDWLINEDFPAATGTDTQTGIPGNVPTTQPDVGATTNPANMPPAENERNDNQEKNPDQDQDEDQEDYSNDPQYPDMPEDDENQDEKLSFEEWKRKFIIKSTKGDVEELKDMIMDVRDNDLNSYARRFVEDNLQIIFLREQSNIDKASKEIRKLIKKELDHNNPATSIIDHMTNVLQTMPVLTGVFIKLTGLRGMKGELHREYIAALTGSVQIGGGGKNEDLTLNETDYSIKISTRFNSEFGAVNIGSWELKTDDPEKFLQPVELNRLEDGSPEERDVLKKRIIIDSIAKFYQTRSFIINVVGEDGTIYMIGWDISTSLKTAYTEGRIEIKTVIDDNTEAMIDNDGEIIQFPEIKINYMKDTGEIGEDGKPRYEQKEFIERKYGQLYLTASLKTLKEASTSFQGLVVKEIPWQGNVSDLNVMRRCVPSSADYLLNNC